MLSDIPRHIRFFMKSNRHHRLPLAVSSHDDGVGASPAHSEPSGVSEGDSSTELMQVGDLARETGKTVRALHLYEELELVRPVARSKGHYRLYGADALLRIRWIGKLQDMGLSLTEIQTVVREWEELNSAPRAMVKMREVYRSKLEETRATLRRLRALEHDLHQSLAYLDTCEVCDPARLLNACTNCDMHGCGDHVPDLVAGFRAN